MNAREDVTDRDKPADSGPDNSGPVKGTRKRRTLIVSSYVAAAVAFTAVGFGATSVIRDQPGSASAASAIPSPPPANQTFTEDDDGTGADSQENILQSTVPAWPGSRRRAGPGRVSCRADPVRSAADQ